MPSLPRHLLSVLDIPGDVTDCIVSDNLENVGASSVLQRCRPVVGLLFDQASHRTRNSFEAAATRLGAGVLDLSSSYQSSLERGEALVDFCGAVSLYVDLLVVRSSSRELVYEMASLVDIPVVNGGNGRDEHPTQALGDAVLIFSRFGRLNSLSIAFVGPVRDSRCARSLIRLLSRYTATITTVAPPHLALDSEFRCSLPPLCEVNVVRSLRDALESDVLYFTGCLPEDFADPRDYAEYADFFGIDDSMFARLKDNAVVLHPLPRGIELPTAFDNDSRVLIREQAASALAVRRLLLTHMLPAAPANRVGNA